MSTALHQRLRRQGGSGFKNKITCKLTSALLIKKEKFVELQPIITHYTTSAIMNAKWLN